MTTALYRRYRPDTFEDVIGQEHVTSALETALSTSRVAHAFLFSGPRGCGKTTSARILARSLNCEEGPTPTPCGECASCIDLASGGPGSLDVIEIDAASHNGVDDARSLRERAEFAPTRDRYRIFILDEAHMVTTQGFNALLKLVEEPPEHVKFIFATTEPDKVITTIRSRTHHYPFRLVPPVVLMPYLRSICVREGVTIDESVLPLVTRAGGGSVRDSLSVLDQLIAGSEGNVTHEQAARLLGFTDSALLDRAVDALGDNDGAATFAVVEEIVEAGHEPRRFVEDLLQRLRDLIVCGLAGPARAQDILVGIPPDQLAKMLQQAAQWGTRLLSRRADMVEEALREMTGATAPRLQLELLLARLLVEQPAESTAPSVRVASHGASVPVASPIPEKPTGNTEGTSGVPVTSEVTAEAAARADSGGSADAPAPAEAGDPEEVASGGESRDSVPSSPGAEPGTPDDEDPDDQGALPSVTTAGDAGPHEEDSAGSTEDAAPAAPAEVSDLAPEPAPVVPAPVSDAGPDPTSSRVQGAGQGPIADDQSVSGPPPSQDDVRQKWRQLLAGMAQRSSLYTGLLGATRGVDSAQGTVRFTLAEEGYVRRFKSMEGEQHLGEVLSQLFGQPLTAQVGTAEQFMDSVQDPERPDDPSPASDQAAESRSSDMPVPASPPPSLADSPRPVPAAPAAEEQEERPASVRVAEDRVQERLAQVQPEAEIDPDAKYRSMQVTDRVLDILGGRVVDEIVEEPAPASREAQPE